MGISSMRPLFYYFRRFFFFNFSFPHLPMMSFQLVSFFFFQICVSPGLSEQDRVVNGFVLFFFWMCVPPLVLSLLEDLRLLTMRGSNFRRFSTLFFFCDSLSHAPSPLILELHARFLLASVSHIETPRLPPQFSKSETACSSAAQDGFGKLSVFPTFLRHPTLVQVPQEIS